MIEMNELLLALFIATQLGDGWTTWQVLRFGGFERTAWIKFLMGQFGTYWALVLYKGAAALAGYWLYHINEWKYLAALTLAYAVQVFWNWRALQTQKGAAK